MTRIKAEYKIELDNGDQHFTITPGGIGKNVIYFVLDDSTLQLTVDDAVAIRKALKDAIEYVAEIGK